MSRVKTEAGSSSTTTLWVLRPNKNGCYFTHFVEGTVPFHVIDGQQVIESLGPSTTAYRSTAATLCRSTADLTSDERIITTSAHAEPRFDALPSVCRR
ncbi:BQ5605_C010g06224 [Microbotryum silenes-dioicae]|uniref:BQ5605_C010g06224 protein n=1 Tax=Microbotryum silenes-dioicae TaxID=796604 RepID=A0A2X0MK44_9BASI|nr:BQ5605_C010g06224 [Microbotryum silenes-dioicae]